MSHCIPYILKRNIIICPLISKQMVKLQAAIKYGEEDFSGAKVTSFFLPSFFHSHSKPFPSSMEHILRACSGLEEFFF